MELSYFNVICEEIDVFDGKVIHINKKAKNVEEVCKIITEHMHEHPTGHWELYPCSVKM